MEIKTEVLNHREENENLVNINEIISRGENSEVEFKASLMWDYNNKTVNEELQYIIARSIASFLNSEKGGTLIIGIKDNEILGIEKDIEKSPLKHPNKDGFYLKIGEIIDNYLGKSINRFVDTKFVTIDNKTICILKIKKASDKVFLKPKNNSNLKFYVRIGNRTNKLEGEELVRWIRKNWPQ